MRHAWTPSERAEELSAPSALAALRAEREAAVVRWRAYAGGTSLHRSEPLHQQFRGPGQPGRWLPDDAPERQDAIRVGYDADGRVVLARGRMRSDGVEHLVTHGDEVEELVSLDDLGAGRLSVSVAYLERDAAGRVVRVTDDQGREDRYRYDDAGRVTELRETHAPEEGEEPWRLEKRAIWATDGELERVEVLRDPEERYVSWRAVQHAQEDELPPLPEVIAGTAAELAGAYAAAVAAAAARLPDACVAAIRVTDAVPAPGAALGDACIAGFRRVKDPDAAVERALSAAHEGDDAVYLDPIAHAAPGLQRRLRQYAQRERWLRGAGRRDDHRSTEQEAAWEERRVGLERAKAELRAALDLINAPGGAPLPTVLWDDTRSWAATIESAGADVVAQLRERLSGRSVAAPASPGALRARADLRAALLARGLERVADAVVADARVGIALAFGGTGRSRLGGVPELPLGIDWPLLDGRAMTPLAAVDCAELPAEADGRTLLPRDGTLLLFAALHEGEHGSLALFEQHHPFAAARVLHLPPGTETRVVDPPPDLLARGEHELGLLRERTVAPRAIVTLRDRLQAPDQFGLGVGESEQYGDICDLLIAQDREQAPGQLLGHPVPVQEDPREEGQELLFELAWSEPLGFELLDGGSLYLLVAAEDLRAGRWERVSAIADSG